MRKALILLPAILLSTTLWAQWNGNSTTDPIWRSGAVGVGVSSPTEKLDIEGTIKIRNNSDSWRLVTNSGGSFSIKQTGFSGALNIYKSGASNNDLLNLYNGMVGIGTTTPDFPLQVRTPLETTDPISYGFDVTRVDNEARGLSIGMATDNSYSVIGAHNADLKLGHTFGVGAGGQPVFFADITIKHTDQSIGKVGIGTSTPSQRLDVNGNIALNNYQILSQGGSSIGFGTGGIGNEDDDITIDIVNDGELELHRAGINLLSIGNSILLDRTNSVNVGIGIEDPKSKLAVNGQIRATEVKVLANIDVPDYVFESDYQLLSLKETKAYITENKHLPEIPSATEIGENGIDLGDMNMRLLKKIEELTLYQIELLERLEQLESKSIEFDKLMGRIQALENK
ncbi:hypothetical protein [Marinoscillum sp. 108]|uniref:hypothetical protein n=1 Tax=Marinoscillum sp. 108 TaxID=2653151 RepID=UPI0012F05DB6|nr:hypothetical protein [Marinoscillum sp. 108]VXD14826.1 conserved exported hypothetical protein [Marinoscillum sp. 108]